MQVKLFNIPISDNGQALEEMNKFLPRRGIPCITPSFKWVMRAEARRAKPTITPGATRG